MKNMDKKIIIKAVIPLIIALLSLFVVSRYATSADFHAKTIASLDEKKTTVMELTAASTAASAAITLLPGDAGNPIAEKLMDLSSYFLIVIAALYLEKYLLTITGYAAFVLLIPIACVIFSANVFLHQEMLHKIAKKMALFGIAIVLVIPSSIKVSDMIEDTYNVSIQNTLDAAKETTEELEEHTEKEDKGVLGGVISSVKEGVTGALNKIETVLNNFIEALAVMIVTSCVIPIVVLFFFIWLVKLILGVDINMPVSSPRRMLKG